MQHSVQVLFEYTDILCSHRGCFYIYKFAILSNSKWQDVWSQNSMIHKK